MIKKENIAFIELAMSYPEVISVVQSVSDRIWYKLTDVTSFEHTAYVACGKELRKSGDKNPRGIALHYANRAAKRHLNKTAYNPPTTFGDVGMKDDDGETKEYEPADVLANVERTVIDTFETQRTIDLLAQADRRKKIVLTAWAEGIADATYISDTLASVLGGNATSHRVFIQRFKTNCKHALESTAI